MIENIKKFGLWILLPVLGLLAYLFNLVNKNRGLQGKVNELELDKQISKQKGEIDGLEKQSADSLAKFRDAESEYRKNRGGENL